MLNTPKGTFVLGLGAQKAGTTWLHDYLSGMEGADFGFQKEYHILDARHLPDCAAFHQSRAARARELLAAEPCDFKANPTLWREIAFEADTRLYYDYFASLLSHGQSVRLTGDISPSYSGLPPEVLADLREAFAVRGVRVAAVFLMRDPVERCWSAVRMARRRRGRTEGDEAGDVLRYARSSLAEIRTRYDRTLEAIDAVFPPEDCFLGFYETIFTEAELKRLCGVLGMPFRKPDFGRRFNGSAKQAAIDPATRAAIAQCFGPVYSAMIARFGADLIASIWPSAADAESPQPA